MKVGDILMLVASLMLGIGGIIGILGLDEQAEVFQCGILAALLAIYHKEK